MHYLFVYFLFICFEGYVRAYASLWHKMCSPLVSAKQGLWSFTVYQQSIIFFRVVSADRLQDTRRKYADPSGREV